VLSVFHHLGRRRPALASGIMTISAAALATTTVLGLAPGTSLAADSAAAACTAGALSCSPASGTPHFPLGTSSTYQVRQLVQCGGEMYAVGRFSSVIGYDGQTHSSKTYTRHGVFRFRATAPYTISGWNPDVSGWVNSIAVGGKNCGSIYLGGDFSKVHGKTAHNIAKVTASSGALQTKFRHNANDAVETVKLHSGRVLTGGFFTTINSSSRRYYVALNSTTGKDDGYLKLGISGKYNFAGVSGNRTEVYNQQLSHGGGRMLVEGDFTSAGGTHRQQIFMLSLGARQARVTAWRSPEFLRNCNASEPFYIRSAAWSVTDTSVYLADTGYYPNGGSNGQASKRTGLCDAAVKFSASERSLSHTWINYTGCDSLYSTVAGSGTAYFGGHERWADNRGACDAAGPGSVAAPGMVGLSASKGAIVYNPTRGRGLGADDMLLTSRGLWIASDNLDGTDTCGGVAGHSGICLLPAS
jgi:hypothetical protein